MDFRENPARATQVFSDASADHGQSDHCPGNAATLHDAHVWAQTHSSGTPDSKNGSACWQRLMALSQRTCQASVAAYTFFIRKVFLDRIFLRPLPASVSSPMVSDVSILCGLCDGPCFSLSSTSLSSANRKTDIVDYKTKLLSPSKAVNTNYSSRQTADLLSHPHKRSDIRTPFDDQWHEP